MLDTKRLMDQFLGGQSAPGGQENGGAGNFGGIAGGALAGGLAGLLTGTKTGRKLGKNASDLRRDGPSWRAGLQGLE